jgi:hypothetical protein
LKRERFIGRHQIIWSSKSGIEQKTKGKKPFYRDLLAEFSEGASNEFRNNVVVCEISIKL